MKNEHTFFIDCEECGMTMNENTTNEFLHKVFESEVFENLHLCNECATKLGATKVVAE